MTVQRKDDHTALERVRRYRQRSRAERGLSRLELQAPVAAVAALKAQANLWRQSFQRLGTTQAAWDRALSTINAPRPHHLDAPGLLALLLSPVPVETWRPHLEAFFDELSLGTLHDLVLSGGISFEDLYRATRIWRLTHARNADWIAEMATLSLARSAPADHSTDRHPG